MEDYSEKDAYNSIKDFNSYMITVQFIVSIIGLLVIIPHLFVITRKSMRTSSTNSLIIGIALCDLIVLSSGIFHQVYQKSNYDSCQSDYVYRTLVAFNTMLFFSETFTRSSYYIGLSLALIRVLVISFPMNLRIRLLAKQSVGYLLAFLMVFMNLLPTANFYLQFQRIEVMNWTPPEGCHGYPSNYTEKVYTLRMGSEDQLYLYELICGILQITICAIYPLLAILLLIQMRKVGKEAVNSNRQSSSHKGRTSKMILVMTISYVISSAPTGISFLVRRYAPSNSVFQIVIAASTYIESLLFIINGSVHCFICLIMSTDYRKTVKGLLRIKEKEVRSIFTKSH